MKKSEIRKLDKIWAEKVKKRAGYKCEYCLEEGRELSSYGVWLNACHIVGRRYRATRWDLANGACWCFGCHRQYDEHGPEELKMIGKARKETLQKKAKQKIAKYQDFEKIKKELER